MKANRPHASGLTRGAALSGRPAPLAVLGREEMADGALAMRVRLRPSRWQRLLGAPPEYERRFVLDALGREVYEACDGKTEVTTIAQRFARSHNVSIAEAEKSVTTYLRTLILKGLIAMTIDKEKVR